ncbi:hypothetical protein ACQ4LE_010767 [Meloidogyne hapla]|uniref:Uncharacterized protein n=1 Tax=Meloidogyne hapla TaxID=6305 RepID=A0A1I8BTV2_MELHA
MSQYDQPPKPGDLYDQPPPVAPPAGSASSAAPPPPKADEQLYDQPQPTVARAQLAMVKSDSYVESRRGRRKIPTDQTDDYEVITDEAINSIIGPNERKKRAAKQKDKQQGRSVKGDTPKRQTASAPKRAAKKKADVEARSVKAPKPPPPKQQKKVEVKNKCCIATTLFLTVASLGLAVFTSMAAFCQLEETIPKEYPWF